MFDPSTVAFEIKYPWKRPSKLFPKGYRDTFIIIWHEDPCADGSDDSCGWSSPKLTKDEADKIKREAKFEMKYWFDISDTGVLTPKTSAESIVYQAFMMIAWRVWQKQIKAKHLPEIMSVTYNHMDNFSDTFRGRWGELKEDDFLRSCHFIGRCFKRMERKWYQHPVFTFIIGVFKSDLGNNLNGGLLQDAAFVKRF